MKWKKIRTSSLAAIFTLGMQAAYGQFFGPENALLGMMSGIIVYALLTEDLTNHPWVAAGKLLALNYFLCLMAYFVGLSPSLGFFVNLVTLFVVAFYYGQQKRGKIAFLFLLLYIVMMSYPIALPALPQRLFALGTGVMLIFGAQLIFNRGAFTQKAEKLLLQAIGKLQVQAVSQNPAFTADTVEHSLQPLLVLIEQRNLHQFHFHDRDWEYLQISFALQRITKLLSRSQQLTTTQIGGIMTQLELLRAYLTDGIPRAYFLEVIKEAILQEQNTEQVNDIQQQVHHVWQTLQLALNPRPEQANDAKKYFQQRLRQRDWLNRNSAMFTYAIRVAVAIAGSLFFVSVFNIPHGSWVVMSTYVVLQPFYEDTQVRAWKRLKGTILGISASLVLFSIVPTFFGSVLFVFVCLLLYYYVSDYYQKVLWMSMLVVGLSIATQNVTVISVSRITLVFGGITIALLFNTLLLPYGKGRERRYLMKRHTQITERLLASMQNECSESLSAQNRAQYVLEAGIIAAQLKNQLNRQVEMEIASIDLINEYYLLDQTRPNDLTRAQRILETLQLLQIYS